MALMASHRFLRLLSTSARAAAAVDKTQLSKLRKATGYGMSNCRDALLKNGHDYDKAAAWLAEQAVAAGWAKATKLSGRAATQGLLALAVSEDRRRAVLLEAKCETDFVARNQVFVGMVDEVARTVLARTCAHQCSEGTTRTTVTPQELASTAFDASSTLADRVALAIGLCGENMKLGRAVQMVAAPAHRLYGITHGGTGSPPTPLTGTPMLGTFGGVVAVEGGRGEPDPAFMRSLCLQVIGMSPKYLGTKEQIAQFKKSNEAKPKEPVTEETASETSEEEEEEVAVMDKTPRDDFLTLQQWMKDDQFTVGEMLEQQGVEVVDFLRVKLGEEE